MTAMNDTDETHNPWPEALRRTGDSLLGLAQTRVELLSVEFQEEKLRAISGIIWLGIALALGVAGLMLALGALALYLWETTGYAGVVGLALACLGGGGGILWGMRRRIHSGPLPFAETIAEFRKDRECLRSER